MTEVGGREHTVSPKSRERILEQGGGDQRQKLVRKRRQQSALDKGVNESDWQHMEGKG